MALHQILLGDQGAAAQWLPFALGQLYACPDSAKVSTSPAPGVEITLTRMQGQDTVQIRAGGNPDFVMLDNVNPTTAYTIPKQFIPNYPNLQTTGPTNAFDNKLYSLGNMRLISSSGEGVQNDMALPYTENIYVWDWSQPWFYPLNTFEIVSAPAANAFVSRDPTKVTDCYYKPDPDQPGVKRLVALQSEDGQPTPTNPGHVHYSDDLGATWTTNPYPAASVPGGSWYSRNLERVDVDKLVYSVYLMDRASGLPTEKLYFLIAGSGATSWGQATAFQPASPLLITSASFYPGNTAGVVNGLATVARIPTTSGSRFLRIIRSVDSCSTFTYTDMTTTSTWIDVGFTPEVSRIHTPADDKDIYAAVWLLTPPMNMGGGLIRTFAHLVYTLDGGVSWFKSPEIELNTEATEDAWVFDTYGFYNGAFYLHFGSKGSGLKRLYFTKDFGVTWAYTTHSEFTGRGLSNSVQCFNNRLAYPHRSDML